MTREEAKKEIDVLTRQINYHNELYYQQNRSEISDQEFDQLMDKLARLEEQFPEFRREYSPTQRVGGTVTKSFESVYHKYPMLSLGNTYSCEELQDFDKRVAKSLNEPYEYFCELKFDGVAISLTYEDGILKRAVTRGDGIKGDNITANAKTVRTIPLKLAIDGVPPVFEARGEVFMHRDVFNQLNREREQLGESLLANPRNTASGTLKMQDSSVVARRKLDCFLYSLLGEDIHVHEHSQRIELLEKWGFQVSQTYKKCTDIHEVFEYIDFWEKRRLEMPVDTDGVVIKVNSLHQQEKLGYTAKSPRWAISYKYKALDASTELLKVTYQVGRTGAITPVANLRPVKLAGTEVKRASLHNANEILRLDLREGDTVFVVKGGEIIPKITGVDLTKRKANSKAIEYVDHCPSCGTKLLRNEGEAIHYCPNKKGCPTQIIGRIEHFIQRQAMDIESMGSRTIALLYEKGLVKTPADLYDLTYDEIHQLEGFKDLSTRNLLNGIEGSKKSPFPNVLYALGIRFVGKTVAENLAQRFKTIDNLANASYEELIATPDIGERIAWSVVDYFRDPDNMRLIEELKAAGLCFELKVSETNQSDNVLNGKTFVISGVFENFERDDLKELIKNKGGKVLTSVSAKLDYLLAGENMGPAKKEKAQHLGVQIISEKDFTNMIR